VSLEVHNGEVVALLGANGAGKTTTLLSIMGFINPLAGRVTLDGADLAGQRASDRVRNGIAFIPDDRGLLPSLTVSENLALVRGRKSDPLDFFPELRPLLNRKAGLLSGGEQQMLAIARAFATGPRLLLLDELSQGLAPKLVARLLHEVRRAADEWDAGVLMVEQEVVNALKVTDRAYVLAHGSLVIENVSAQSLLKDDQELLALAYLGSARETNGHREVGST
jgi:branched-chain amino acid transport system ATP-binding protein